MDETAKEHRKAEEKRHEEAEEERQGEAEDEHSEAEEETAEGLKRGVHEKYDDTERA